MPPSHSDPDVAITQADYRRLFEGQSPVPNAFRGVCGRVIRFGRGEKPEYLSYPHTRRLAWVIGPDGLVGMVGKPGLKILLELGILRDRIEANLTGGMRWALAVFPERECISATWDGLFGAIGRRYPPGVEDRLRRHEQALRRGPSLLDPDETRRLGDPAVREHPEHAEHMTAERYLASADTPANAWLFLWHSAGMNSRFDGNGRSRADDGTSAYAEFLAPNVRLAEFGNDLALIEFDVAGDVLAAGWQVPPPTAEQP